MRTARIVCAVALLAQLLLGCQASLMAIDLGSEFIKVSLVKPGRTPISVVVNEMSRRKSPAMVGLINEDRVIGEEAFTMLGRYPERIVQFATNLLGRLPDDPTIERTFKDFHLPHKVVAHPTRGVASIQYSDGTVLSAEELVVS